VDAAVYLVRGSKPSAHAARALHYRTAHYATRCATLFPRCARTPHHTLRHFCCAAVTSGRTGRGYRVRHWYAPPRTFYGRCVAQQLSALGPSRREDSTFLRAAQRRRYLYLQRADVAAGSF